MRQVLAIVVFAVGCRASKAKPLADELPGRWDLWCEITKPEVTACAVREHTAAFLELRRDGTYETRSIRDFELTGTWSITGDELATTTRISGREVVETQRVQIVDGRLVTWTPEIGLGAVYGRSGATFTAAPAGKTTGAPVTRTLGSARYTIALPAGYVLTGDAPSRHTWKPATGDGLTIELDLVRRDPGIACDVWGAGRVTEEVQAIEGVERVTAVGFSDCIEDRAVVLSCDAEHPRGHFERAERDAGLALCKTAKLAR